MRDVRVRESRIHRFHCPMFTLLVSLRLHTHRPAASAALRPGMGPLCWAGCPTQPSPPECRSYGAVSGEAEVGGEPDMSRSTTR